MTLSFMLENVVLCDLRKLSVIGYWKHNFVCAGSGCVISQTFTY
jgi:hypothetical protein